MFGIVAYLLLASATARVTDFVLVDTSTGRDVMILLQDTAIDTSEHGDQLSVRVETDFAGEDTIRLDMDHGSTVRVGKADPMYLAGTQNGKPDVIFPSNVLVRSGPHTLQACVITATTVSSRRLVENDQDNSCLEISFETVNVASVEFKFGTAEPNIEDMPRVPASVYGAISGELRQWHKITLGFRGPPASETGMTVPGSYRAPTPFADYRLDVSFNHPTSGKKYIVPGYYAADGNSANTHAVSGSVWIVHFTPPLVGRFDWFATFTQGTDVAMQGGGNPGHFFDSALGFFDIQPTNKEDPRDLRFSKGRLMAKGSESLHFADGNPFVAATDERPFNILAYNQFDGAPNGSVLQETFECHAADFGNEQGKTFANGKGVELIGAINHLVSNGINVLTATTLRRDEAFPFRRLDNLLYYDVSKLAQWGAIFDYATERGLSLRIRLDDYDRLFDEQYPDHRKLFFREMVARFGHNLAVVWELGGDLTETQMKERRAWLRALDPYDSTPIVVREE